MKENFVLLFRGKCLIILSKASYARRSREGMEDSDGRDRRNMWDRVEVFCRMWFNSTLMFGSFEVYKLCTGLFVVVVEYHRGSLSLCTGATLYHFRYHLDNNRGRNLGRRNIWLETVVALSLLTWNCISRTAMCVLRNCRKIEYISLCDRRDTLSDMT